MINGIDVDNVTAWLDGHIDGIGGPYTFDLIPGGRSNLTFTVTDSAGTKVVLRRPPTGAVLAAILEPRCGGTQGTWQEQGPTPWHSRVP